MSYKSITGSNPASSSVPQKPETEATKTTLLLPSEQHNQSSATMAASTTITATTTIPMADIMSTVPLRTTRDTSWSNGASYGAMEQLGSQIRMTKGQRHICDRLIHPCVVCEESYCDDCFVHSGMLVMLDQGKWHGEDFVDGDIVWKCAPCTRKAVHKDLYGSSKKDRV